MYFLFFILHRGSKRYAAQPQTIYSEFPIHRMKTVCFIVNM